MPLRLTIALATLAFMMVSVSQRPVVAGLRRHAGPVEIRGREGHHETQRLEARSRVDVPDGRRTRLPVQSRHRRRRHVRAGQGTARWWPSTCVTRKELWIHANLRGITNRGINYWQSSDGKDRRLLFALEDTLQAIDARTGKSILSFGKNGIVDLQARAWGAIRRPCGAWCQSTPGRDLRGSADPRQFAGRGLFLCAGPHPRIQRDHRRARLDVPHHSAAGRVRLRHMAEGRVEIRRRRERLG